MMEIRQASQDKIRNVLTDEQKTKFDAMQAKMQARRQNRRGGAEELRHLHRRRSSKADRRREMAGG